MKKLEIDSFRSLSNLGESEEIIIKKSRFIGYARMTLQEDDALAFIDKIHKMHPDSSCVVHAYICTLTGSVQRFFNAHEPVGGMPILDVLKAKGLIGAACCVVRYYGGIKLGIGGLSRAFSRAASKAIDAAKPVLYEIGHRYELIYDYKADGRMMFMLDNSVHRYNNKRFSDKIRLEVEIKDRQKDEFLETIAAITSGKYELVESDRVYTI